MARDGERAHRPKAPNRCPACSGQQVSVTNCLARVAPAISRQWHPTKNGRATPANEIATAWKRRWWKCPAATDHEWREHTWTRTMKRRGCPFCRKHRPRVSTATSLATLEPALTKEWHPTLNGALHPERVGSRSTKRAWWVCKKGPDHVWSTTISSRTHFRSGCPFCNGKRVSVTNSLATRAPGVASQWHPTKNGSRTPADVHYGSCKSAWWLCVVGHAWRTRIAHRTHLGSGCPTCEVLQRRGRAPAIRRVSRVRARLPSRE
jgi:hypothetical protein